MIQPQELRIGNYVQFMGETKTVLCIDSEYDAPNKNYKGSVIIPTSVPKGSVRHVQCIDLKPIPITPEILERCDFEKCESDDVEERDIYTIQVANNHSLYFDPTEDPQWYISYEWNNNHFKNSFWAQPEYLHQLQNLYYSLTNQELTFKTTTHD